MSFDGPTISAPSSPSVFHAHSRTYHASGRTSASPRFLAQVSSAASRRNDAPPPSTSTSAGPSQSPVASYPRSPQPRKREQTAAYVDAGTQYSPEGYPPTHHPRAPPATADVNSTASTQALPRPTAAHTQRRETSAEPLATEPPQPQLAEAPQPVVPVRNAQSTVSMSAEGETPVGQPVAQPATAGTTSLAGSSPSKRLRAQDPEPKIMPLKYETCDVKDLGVLISDMLMELVRLNDGFPLRDGHLTRFHSRAPPAISVRDYLFRLIVHATLSPPILLSMVFYVDKLCTMYSAFTISSLTVHRFLITAATVAAKGLSDSFWTNGLYAKVGGVSIRELALLELEFLRRLEWRIVPKPETLVDYYKGLVERGAGYVLEREAPLDLSNTPASTSAPDEPTVLQDT